MVCELDVMTGVGLVYGKNLEHMPVVFLQEALHLLIAPIGWRWADRIDCLIVWIKRRSRLDVGERVSTMKFRHFRQLALVGFGQAKNILGSYEFFQLLDGGPCVGEKAFGCAMFLSDGLKDTSDSLVPALKIVGRESKLFVISGP